MALRCSCAQVQNQRVLTLVVSVIVTAVICLVVYAVSARNIGSLIALIHAAGAGKEQPEGHASCLMGEFAYIYGVRGAYACRLALCGPLRPSSVARVSASPLTSAASACA
jgi:hypothetical protein